MMEGEFVFLGSAGRQPAAFARRAECIFTKTETFETPGDRIRTHVRRKLPRTTGQRPVLPGFRLAP